MINKIVRITLTYESFSSLLNMQEISGCALIHGGNLLIILSTVERKGMLWY